MATKPLNPFSKRLREMQDSGPLEIDEGGAWSPACLPRAAPAPHAEMLLWGTHGAGWVESLGAVFQQEPITVQVSLPPEHEQRLTAIEQRIARIENQLQALSNSLIPDASLESRFQSLVAEWKAGRDHKSSVFAMSMHPAYQQIIGMGQRVLPLLLAEMEQRPSHWSWALRSITAANPVPEQSKGKLKEMAAAWAKWGREQGHLQ